jgi:hypothetical protein
VDTTPESEKKADLLENLKGVGLLIDRRGSEEVRFSQVADHLVDFAARRPQVAPIIDELGRYLADVELRPHDHDQPAGSAGG